jgi:hypothetical protein
MGTMKMALKLVLLTLVRKTEFTRWKEVDFRKGHGRSPLTG